MHKKQYKNACITIFGAYLESYSQISNRRQKNYVLFDIFLFAGRLLLYYAIFRKIANFSVSCFFTSKKRGSRYLKNGCFDWAVFLTQDLSYPFA